MGRRKREVDRNIGRNRDTVRGTEGQGQGDRDRGIERRKREVDGNIGRNRDTVRGTEGQGQGDRGTGGQGNR